MGIFINKGNEGFRQIRNSEYVDKTGLIAVVDFVLMPRKNVAKPAIVIELKSNKTASKAIEQIKVRNYPQKVAEYTGDILLVGINYDTDTKEHTCKIERWEK